MTNLLLSSGFGSGVTVSSPYNIQSVQAWERLQGTDSTTGFTWPGTLWGGSQIQMLTEGGTLSNVISNSIDTVTGHDGTQTAALDLNVMQKVTGITQDAFLIQPATSPTDFYTSMWIQLPSNLQQLLGPGGWVATAGEWKTTNDFRSYFGIYEDGSGKLQWEAKWDNLAGSLPQQTFWHAYNSNVPVSAGQWMHLETYTHRDATNGETWLKVNGQTVFDHTGDNIGVENDPINRIFLANSYSNAPLKVLVDDLQVHDGVPATTSTTPTPVNTTVGSGSGNLVLKISEDAYQGDARYMVSVDGQQISGTQRHMPHTHLARTISSRNWVMGRRHAQGWHYLSQRRLGRDLDYRPQPVCRRRNLQGNTALQDQA